MFQKSCSKFVDLAQKLERRDLVCKLEELKDGIKIKKCDEMYLEVRCSNNDAVKLYENMGVIRKQRLKTYYRDGEDAYLMATEFET